MNKDNETNENVFGKGMLYLGITLLLGLLLVWFFDGKLNALYNPNENISSKTNNGFTEIILQRNAYNHYVSNGKINGQDVTLFLDTGATSVSIPERLAKKLKLKKGFPYEVSTANGIITVYSTTLKSISIGEIKLENVQASINPNYDEDILLGMSFLKDLDFSQSGDQLTIRQNIKNNK